MQPRMTNPAFVLPDAMAALQQLAKVLVESEVPGSTLDLVYLRASQINGCGFSVGMHSADAKRAGETDERLLTLPGWRESAHFTEAERAALALTEAMTRLADRPEGVPDAVWEEASRHYEEHQLAALVLAVATVNFWNRVNSSTRQLAS